MMNKNIVIVGSGGLAREIYSYIKYDIKHSLLQNVNIKGFVDKDLNSFNLSRIPEEYLGDEFSCSVADNDYFIVALGFKHNSLRRKIIGILGHRGARFFSYIHSSSFVGESVKIEEGVIICPNCVVTSGVIIGKHSILNIYSSVGHNCLLGEYSILSPYATLNGGVNTGHELFMGTNSVVLEGLTIGDKCRISAGVVLTKNIGDNSTVFNKAKHFVLQKGI